MSAAALAADPGSVYPATSEVSDQKAGSVLFYNTYTSGATSGNTENTRVNITNTSSTSAIVVHLYFVAEGCSVADSFICLTANQTASFLTSDVDPGIRGYIVAVAVEQVNGCPTNFNHLIGDLYLKAPPNFAANLGAEAFSALFPGGKDQNGNQIPAPASVCDPNSPTAVLNFDGSGTGYNRAPRVLALSNIPSRADGNETVLVINRFGGNLATGAATIATLFGLLYDDAENVLSFSLTSGNCQLRGTLSNTFPRVAPRFENFIPAGRSGWMKIFSQSDIALSGAMINGNANAAAQANAFNGGHNLHKLTLTSSAVYTVPIFPPSC
jgi:hypothetical protein